MSDTIFKDGDMEFKDGDVGWYKLMIEIAGGLRKFTFVEKIKEFIFADKVREFTID